MEMNSKRLELIRETQRALSKEDKEPDTQSSNEEEFWIIPVIWECWGKYRIPKSKCATLEEAIAFIHLGATPLPDQGEYIDDSMRIDMEGIPIHNPSEEES